MTKKKKKPEKIKADAKILPGGGEMEQPVKEKDPRLVKKEYPLIRNVKIGGVLLKPPHKVALTEKGRQYFKSLNYIK